MEIPKNPKGYKPYKLTNRDIINLAEAHQTSISFSNKASRTAYLMKKARATWVEIATRLNVDVDSIRQDPKNPTNPTAIIAIPLNLNNTEKDNE